MVQHKSLLSDLNDWAKESPTQIALVFENNQGDQVEISASQYAERVAQVCQALENSGLQKGDRCLILSRNRPEWLFSELGATLCGALCGGLYGNSSKEDYAHILALLQPKFLFVENQDSFERLPKDSIESLEQIVVFEGNSIFDSRAISWERFLQRSGVSFPDLEKQLQNLNTEDPAFMILTSGTTGLPKAAMLSHRNLYFSASCYKSLWNPPKDGKLYSFLPASHVAEKVYSLGHGLHFRFTVHFCSDMFNLLKGMAKVQPVAFLATPRIWETIMERTQKHLEGQSSTLFKRVYDSATHLSRERLLARMENRRLAPHKEWVWRILDKKVLSKIRNSLGLGQALKNVNGAAALPESVRSFFRGIGINIIDAYAQTESSGVLAGQVGDVDCAGTLGFPAPGTEFRITKEGEILSKGPHVFCGYYAVEKLTDSTVREGWLHTGDLGEQNEKGQIVFLGRKRDIIKPLEGKLIAPSKIEDKLHVFPEISSAIVFGDGERFLSAVIVPNRNLGLTRELLEARIKSRISTLNKSLARHERLQKYHMMDRELRDEELTPTLKIKRHIVYRNLRVQIDELYGRSSIRAPRRDSELQT